MSETDREREEEFEALQAISCTSETQLPLTSTASGYPDLPVALSTPLPLLTERTADSTADQHVVPQRSVSSLPHVCFALILPNGYPNSVPPQIDITCTNSWAPRGAADELLATRISLSEDYGHAQVLFALTSHVEEQANSAFGATQLTVTNDALIKLCTLIASKRSHHSTRKHMSAGSARTLQHVTAWNTAVMYSASNACRTATSAPCCRAISARSSTCHFSVAWRTSAQKCDD
jgi:hypothetical protein